MLKFTIDMRDLKPTIDKVSMVVDKKTLAPALRRCYFQITDCQRLRVYATDLNHFLEMDCEAVHGADCGRIGIDVDDLKTITKMTGDITITETLANNKPAVTVKNQKKCIILPARFEEGMDLPEMKNAKPILQMDSSWLLETISKLSCFTMEGTVNKLAGSICLNVQTKRAEALDSNHAGMRKFPDKTFIHQNEEVKLPHQSFSVLKTILDKAPGKDVLIFRDGKYVEVAGPGFTYMVREVDGKFFDINRFLKDTLCNTPYRIKVEKEEFIKIIQYASSLIKKERISLILHGAQGRLFSYLNTGQYEILDEVRTEKAELPEGFFVGFPPYRLLNILKALDIDTIELHVGNEMSAAYVEGNEYSFLICPTRIMPEDKEAAEKLILAEFV